MKKENSNLTIPRYLTCELPYNDNSDICKNCQSHDFCVGVVNQENKILEQRWCGNCKFAEIKKDESIYSSHLVTIKCIFVLPMWAKLWCYDGEEPDEDELRGFHYYEDVEQSRLQCSTIGSDCKCWVEQC